MKIIDSHAHLMDEMYESDVEEVINRCIENNMEYIVNVGYDKASSYKAVELSEKYDFMYATIGLHPDEFSEEVKDFDFLIDLAKNKKVVAVGEVGLDYHYLPMGTDFFGSFSKPNSVLNFGGEEDCQKSPSPLAVRIKENQRQGFIRQIQLANELSLPVAIHSRDADMDMLKVLKENKISKGFVMHCFSSSVEIAKEVLKLGGFISLSGTVTFKNAKDPKKVAEMVPIDKLLVETDCPYLSPEPYRGKRNEPWHVWETAKKIAEIKQMELEEFVQIVNDNIKRFYGIS